MRRRLLGLAASLLIPLAACGGSNPAKNPLLAAGVTSTAAPSTTTATTEAVTTSTGRGTTTTSTSTPTSGAPAPCSPNGTSLKVTAMSIQFDAKCLAAPANQAFSIAFNNQDAGTPHNVAIFSADPATHPDAQVLFRGDLVTGVAAKTYQVTPLPGGTYFFHCDVHPTVMFGTFVVK